MSVKVQETQVDIKVCIPFPINLIFPSDYKNKNEVLFIERPNIKVTLINSDVGKELRMTSEEDSLSLTNKKDAEFFKQYFDLVNRTLVSPLFEIHFQNYLINNTELPYKKNFIKIDGNNLDSSSWFSIANKTVSVFNTTINELYRVYKIPVILSRKLAPITLIESNTTTFPDCLSYWNPSIYYKQASITNLQFELLNTSKISKYPQIGISGQEEWFDIFTENVKKLDLIEPKLSLFWHFLILAEEKFQNEEIRLAIIDFDIACDYILREWIKTKVNINEALFNKETNDRSTGDLIKCAKLIFDKSEMELIKKISSLHSTRNTILHQHQRHFKKEHYNQYIEAKRAAIRINQDLEKIQESN